MRKKTTKKILNPEHNKKIKKIYCFAIGIELDFYPLGAKLQQQFHSIIES